MKTIEVRIQKDGKIVIHVQGMKGAECTNVTTALEAILGGNATQDLTPEYFASGDGELMGQRVTQ